MSLQNSSYVPSPPTLHHSFHFHFCFAGCIHHSSGRQGLPLCALSIRPFPDFLSSYSSSKGGRLVTERRMVTDMYVFNLKTLVWEKVIAPADDCTPAQRYFHSADSCQYRLSSLMSSRLTVLDREPISHHIWWHGIETRSCR
jgi:hypothetical protein